MNETASRLQIPLQSAHLYQAILQRLYGMRRHLYKILVAVTLLATSLPAFAVQNSWQRVTDHEVGFIVSFPSKPIYAESTDPETGQPLETYSFYYNGNLLQVVFTPLVPAPRTAQQVNLVLSNTAGVYARNAGFLLRQEKLPGHGRQFDNLVKTPSGTLHLRSRIYIHQGKLFTLSCGSYDVNGIDERVAEQFFSSFSFTDSLLKRSAIPKKSVLRSIEPRSKGRARWYTHRGADDDFIVEFPGKPDYLQLAVPSTNIPLHRYHYSFGENKFMVSYYNTNVIGSLEQILKQAVENYISAYPNWRLIHKEQLTDGSYLIEMRGVAEGFPIHTQTRLYMRNSRLYLVTSHTQNLSGPNRNDVNRFFSSFHLL